MASSRDEPSAPTGWESSADRLIRLADPDGGAVAWLAPDRGANCVGYAVRRPDGWAQVLHAAGPRALEERPTHFGLPILFPFPGHVRNARYRWAGVDHALPPNVPGRHHYVHGFAQSHPWRVERTAADAIEAQFSTATDLADEARAGYPFAVRLRLSLRLEGAALAVTLEATNEGDDSAPVGLGLHPYFAPDPLGGDRAAVRARLPGRAEHVLAESIPTGERRAVASPDVAVPPNGQLLLVARTELGDRPVASLTGPRGGSRVVLTLAEGCRDLLLYAPPAQPSISLEPHSGAPGAASQPEGHPDGLVGLAPGATTRLAVTIAAEDG